MIPFFLIQLQLSRNYNGLPFNKYLRGVTPFITILNFDPPRNGEDIAGPCYGVISEWKNRGYDCRHVDT